MIVLITGGASGLGEAITRKMSKKADKVYFTYSKSDVNAKKLEEEFLNTHAIKCDFSISQEVSFLCEQITELQIDVVVNNAYNGSFIQSYFHKTESTNYLEEFNGNILPTIAITQAAINVFRKKKKGKIITILTSALQNTPPLGASIYVANKAYLKKLTQVWATENSKFGITSNTISPSFMKTSMTSEMDERIVDQIQDQHPLKTLLTPNEVAETVVFLSDASAHINGIDIVMNAGTTIQ